MTDTPIYDRMFNEAEPGLAADLFIIWYRNQIANLQVVAARARKAMGL